MPRTQNERIFRIRTESIANPVVRTTVGLTRGILEHSLGLRSLDAIYARARSIVDDRLTFAQKALRAMDVRLRLASGGNVVVPPAGPLLIVANHPFGGIEGVLLLAFLETVRPDLKVMANYLLGCIPELRDRFIFVDPFGTAHATHSNVRPIKQSLAWLRQGGALGVFPAGEVSSVDLRSGKVRDPAWSPTIAALARRTEATVLPIFFAGHNGPIFHLAGLIHPRLRTLMLPQQLSNKAGRELTIHVGQPIPWKDLAEYSDDRALVQYLRLRSYILAEREEPRLRRLLAWRLPRRRARQEPVAEAGPPDAHAAEVAALPAEQRLLGAGDCDVYYARAEQIPALMAEIGRLREITFRAVGEGTGRRTDLDDYDAYYLHLFIWNRTARELVGAYRLGLADEIYAAHGIKGLYTYSLFRFDRRLLSRLLPAIELGRSFVRPEYQKAYASLLLLWKGLSAFIVRHPRYRVLFGPVSITNEYRDASRNLMLRSLRLTNFEHDLARLVRARRRPRRPRRAEWNLPDFHPYIDNIELVSKLIQEIENDQKGIPVLLRQYLKVGGRLLAFNVDPKFSSVVDGLIAVDLLRTDPKVLRRYMGAAVTDAFLRHHGAVAGEA
jgi:putative hemolysin